MVAYSGQARCLDFTSWMKPRRNPDDEVFLYIRCRCSSPEGACIIA